MVKIIIKRGEQKFTQKSEIRSTGKAGRLERMFALSRNLKKSLDFKVKPSRVDIAVAHANLPKSKLIDVANYHCNKGKAAGVNTVRSKEKRRLGCRPLI